MENITGLLGYVVLGFLRQLRYSLLVQVQVKVLVVSESGSVHFQSTYYTLHLL